MSTTATFSALRLKFESSVTFSLGKPDYARGQDHLYSDTIKSALASAIVKLLGPANLMAFWDSFRVSSAFPFVGKELFFPIPLKGFQIAIEGKENDVKNRKKTGRLRYLSRSLFEQGLQGKSIQIREAQVSPDGSMVSANDWLKSEDSRPEFNRATTQRVSVNAGNGDAESGNAYDPEPFFLEQHFPGKETGWYFLVQRCDPNDTKIIPLIKAAMSLLEDEGLGTAKSRGMGHFQFEMDALSLQCPDATAATHSLNLSLYCPAQDELQAAFWEQGAWGLLKRGGHIAVTDQQDAMRLRKKSIFMLTEGSVFPKSLKLQGKYVDLQPANKALWQAQPILREGRPIFLPFVMHTPKT